MQIPDVNEKWPGKVREVKLGATASEGGTRAKTVTVGGETTLPFLHFEGEVPHPPAVALEIQDFYPDDWSPLLLDVWGDALRDPAAWAKKAEEAGADLIALTLRAADEKGKENTPEHAVETVKKILGAMGLPLIVYGPGQAELDNKLLEAISAETKGERIVMGRCEDKNYQTIVGSAMADGHLVIASTPIDVNLAKQLNILISDMALPLDRVLMDPTTGALGYGLEYTYSVMERLRLAALQGDSMTQLPMICYVGGESWRQKESKVGHDVPAQWGEWNKRAVNWEVTTAISLLHSGADIVVLRHPESVNLVKGAIARLMSA